jgi:16S rRNA (guanine527-N7)-methyltransferase
MFHVEQPLFIDVLLEGTSTFGIKLSQRQVSSLVSYYCELDRWSQKINLTSIHDTKETAIKHFLDSLLYGQALDGQTNASLLDVGSGAGFPGLPLKIMMPELSVTLLEPNEKKTAFLRHVIGTIELQDVSVISKSLRDFTRDTAQHGRFSYITTRAVAADQILPFSVPLLSEQGRVIFCLAKELENQSRHGFKVTRTIGYDLPHRCGHRVLTVLERTVVA